MFKRIRLYSAVTLLIQSVTFFFLVIIFLFRNKKNTAGAFFGMSIAGGVLGGILLAKHFRETFKDKDIFAAFDEMCENGSGEEIKCDIPVDDSANEAEFAAQ